MKGWYFRLTSLIKKDSKGLTLLELLIALSIAGLIVAATTTTISQLFSLGSRNENYMVAVRQVQNAGYLISRDGVMAQKITVANTESGFPLTLSWGEWGGSQTITVTYTLIDSILSRQEVANGKTTTAQIARHIVSAQVEFPKGEKLLTVTITAQVKTASETRTYQIKPRPID